MKKYLACILALALMLALCACGGDPEPSGTEGAPAQSASVLEGLEFESNGDGTCMLVGIGRYTGTELVISGTSPEGETITAIGEAAFMGCTSIEKLTISGVELTVHSGAFFECTNLSEFTIKNSTLTLEYSVFDETSVETVQIENSTVNAGEEAFYTDTLVGITIKDSTVNFGDGAIFSDTLVSITAQSSTVVFEGEGYYPSLQELMFTNCDVTIADDMFSFSESLTTLIVEGGSAEIGEQAFENCGNLTTLTLKCRASLGEEAFGDCSSLTSVEFSDDHIELGNEAFAWCNSLTTVTIGNADVDFGEDVFYECPEELIIHLDGKKFNSAFEEIISEEEKKQAYTDLQNNLSAEKVVALNALFLDDMSDGELMLSTDVQNNMDVSIRDVLVTFAAWDADGNPVLIKGASATSTESYIKNIELTDIVIGAGETWKAEDETDAVTGDTIWTGYIIDPSLTNICYVKTMIASCTLEDGTTWENPYYDEWVNTLGGIVLDEWMME